MIPHLRRGVSLGLLACLLLSGPAAAQVARIPFEFHRNKILLPVTVNGTGPYEFILDSGSPVTVVNSFALAGELGFGTGRRVTIGGAGEQTSPPAAVLGEARVSLGPVDLGQERLIAIDVRERLAANSGRMYQGIIGRTLFQRYLVELDFGARELVLHDPGAWVPPPGATVIPIRIDNGHPHLDAMVRLEDGRELMLDLVVDTGARGGLLLDMDGPDRVGRPAGGIRMAVGYGVRGPIRGYAGRVAALELGGIRLDSLRTVFMEDSLGVTPGAVGNLGTEILRRFDVVFDYPGQRLILVPTLRIAEPVPIDLSGISLRASGSGWQVLEAVEVRPGSPAATAGLRGGDRILAADGVPATDLEALETRLTAPGPVRLRIDRAGEAREVQLELIPIP